LSAQDSQAETHAMVSFSKHSSMSRTVILSTEDLKFCSSALMASEVSNCPAKSAQMFFREPNDLGQKYLTSLTTPAFSGATFIYVCGNLTQFEDESRESPASLAM
jgi:hypothetical protein